MVLQSYYREFCLLVYCTGLLGSNGMRLRSFQRSDLLFNIGLCDNDALGSLDAFIACKVLNHITWKKYSRMDEIKFVEDSL